MHNKTKAIRDKREKEVTATVCCTVCSGDVSGSITRGIPISSGDFSIT